MASFGANPLADVALVFGKLGSLRTPAVSERPQVRVSEVEFGWKALAASVDDSVTRVPSSCVDVRLKVAASRVACCVKGFCFDGDNT